MDTPKSLEDFIKIIRLTPRTVLSEKERVRIAAVMGFEGRTVKDLMRPRAEMVFVKSDEMLGPLVLDKLYRSGYMNFPVVNSHERVVGILNTEALNALEVRKLEKAERYMSKAVNYLSETDTLVRVVEEVKRTGGYYFLVTNEQGTLAGFLTVGMIFDYLLGKNVV